MSHPAEDPEATPKYPWGPERPPTEDELPYDDAEPMETTRHRRQMNLLIELTEWHLREVTDKFVAGNMAIYCSLAQIKRADFKAPDFFVVRNTTAKPKKSWVVWEADGTPDVVVELLSPSTEKEHRGRKKRIYAQSLKVGEYFLYDPATGALEGFRLDLPGHTYVAMAPSDDGSFTSTGLGADLVVVPGEEDGEPAPWLRLRAPDGTLVPTTAERAEAERERADRLAAKLRAAGLDPEG